jgi:predicted transcriptional regulator
MTIRLTSEHEAELAQIAAQKGCAVDSLVREAVDRYLAEEAHFRAAVQEGIEAADRGGLLTSGEVWAQIERRLSLK